MHGVIIGVDPLKLPATIEVVDPSERLLGTGAMLVTVLRVSSHSSERECWVPHICV